MAKQGRRLRGGVAGCGPRSRSPLRASTLTGRIVFLQSVRDDDAGRAQRFGGLYDAERVCSDDDPIPAEAAG